MHYTVRVYSSVSGKRAWDITVHEAATVEEAIEAQQQAEQQLLAIFPPRLPSGRPTEFETGRMLQVIAQKRNPKVKEVARELGCTTRTVRDRLAKLGTYNVHNGFIYSTEEG